MKKYLSIMVLCVAALKAAAQITIHKDPAIEKMVSEVNADSLSSYVYKLVGFGTRHTLSTTSDPNRGIGAAREWIVSKLKSFASTNPRMAVGMDKWTMAADGRRIDVTAEMANCMAILHGNDTADKRIFVISGHMDSRVSDPLDRVSDAPGADDDGSGTAAVIECARIMSKNSFPATIIFVTVCGEEQGLFGSEHLASEAKQENWNVQAVLNNDIIGGNGGSETNITANDKVRVFSEGLPAYELDKKAAIIRQYGLENDGQSRQLARYIKEIGERYVANLQLVMIYRNDRFLRGGDHISFVQKGFAAVRFTEMNENFYHQHQNIRNENGIQFGDLPQFLDFEYLRKNTAMNLCNLANLAKSPPPPQDLKMETRNLTNYTHLTWKRPLVGKIQGYYVLIRETTSSVWQTKLYTTSTEIRLPYSKDDYFFAVQSVSGDGNEGLPVVPMGVN